MLLGFTVVYCELSSEQMWASMVVPAAMLPTGLMRPGHWGLEEVVLYGAQPENRGEQEQGKARGVAALGAPSPAFLCLPSSSLETQECLGAPVLRGPPAGQDECRRAAGAHEAAPEGLGPRAQENTEPRREDGPSLGTLPRPAAPRGPGFSMLGRRAGAGSRASPVS